MKATKSKKLNTLINTICDFTSTNSNQFLGTTETTTSLGTDPTNTTVTIVTHISTKLAV
jgi:hypothetical protein